MFKSEVPENLSGYDLFEKRSPFEYSGVTKIGSTTGNVFFATYSPRKKTAVPGLGTWINQTDSNQIYQKVQLRPADWITPPSPGAKIAIKIAHNSDRAQADLTRECVALETANGMFDNDDKHRPVKIFGFGNTQGLPYIITEIVPAEFNDLRTVPNTISPDQALVIAASMSLVIAKLHRKGIVHNDLVTPDNIFRHQITQETRLIDFGNTRFAALDQHPPYHYDQRSIGSWLLRRTTGRSVAEFENYAKSNDSNLEKFWGDVPFQIREIVGRTLGVNPRYPNSPDGTQELANDILRATNSLIPDFLKANNTIPSRIVS